jgi:hypothetical protein
MIHTPILSEKHFKELQEGLEAPLVDSSYINDTCDSVYCEHNDITIYLPNSVKGETSAVMVTDSFDTFTVEWNSNEEHGETELSEPMNSLCEVINYINNRLHF